MYPLHSHIYFFEHLLLCYIISPDMPDMIRDSRYIGLPPASCRFHFAVNNPCLQLMVGDYKPP